MLDPQGPRQTGLVIETMVTTKLLGEMVKRSPGSKIIDDLPVGFKYVADVLKSLELTGSYARQGAEGVKSDPQALILAAEESHGVIVLPTIRDKDATPACVYLAALYQRLHQERRTLFDYYLNILAVCGGYDSVSRSITMFGADGTTRRDSIMKSLRENRPKLLDGEPVHSEVVDLWDEKRFGKFKSETDKLPRNVFQFSTDKCIITVRPSGTEPKIKLYCQLLPDAKPSGAKGVELFLSLRERSERLTRSVYGDLLERGGLGRLDHAALLLPDIVAFDLKAAFQKTTAEQLREGLKTNRWANLADLLAWLREQTARMTPGANPLPALRAPVAYLCGQWRQELSKSPVFPELEKWAKP
jgi:hypothetical protein